MNRRDRVMLDSFKSPCLMKLYVHTDGDTIEGFYDFEEHKQTGPITISDETIAYEKFTGVIHCTKAMAKKIIDSGVF